MQHKEQSLVKLSNQWLTGAWDMHNAHHLASSRYESWGRRMNLVVVVISAT
jgi:hypothetical protein